MKIGTKVLAFGKSLHAGQKGTVVEDWGNYLLVKADDETYPGAHNNTGREGKYFQLDSRLCKELKDEKNNS